MSFTESEMHILTLASERSTRYEDVPVEHLPALRKLEQADVVTKHTPKKTGTMWDDQFLCFTLTGELWWASQADEQAAPAPAGVDPRDYAPQKQIVNLDSRFSTDKQIDAALRKQKWIRSWKPGPQRRMIHAGDWLRFLLALDKFGKGATELPDELNEQFIIGSQERKQQIDAQKRAGK
jgi:hypothetical protein